MISDSLCSECWLGFFCYLYIDVCYVDLSEQLR